MDRNTQRALGAMQDTSQQPAFDYERSLARLGGDPHLFDEIVVLFLEDSPQLLAQARRSFEAHDLPTLERAAHSLKGLSVNFDAAAMAAAAYSLEQGAHDGDLERAQESLHDMERELARLQADLSAFRDSERGARANDGQTR